MRVASWNVNGLRSAWTKGLRDWFAAAALDVVCLQEIKATHEQLPPEILEPQGYQAWFNPAQRKGWSGVASFSRIAPLQVSMGLPQKAFQGEGRLIHLEFEGLHLVNCYFPNGRMSLERLAYKLGYYEAWLEFVQRLREDKPVLACGDFNTAHKEIDLAHPARNAKHSGFLPEERAWLDRFVDCGFVDTLRMFEPGPGKYTWWSNFSGARQRNVGWRIDYCFVSEELKDKVTRAWIEPEVPGSDHCPVGIELNL